MADFQASHERLLKQYIRSRRCRVCRRGFEQSPVRVAAKYEELWIVSVRCSRCRKQEVFYVNMTDTDDDSSPYDLTVAEEEYFASLPPISSDDQLDLHEFLTEFDGDFVRHFKS